MLDNDPLSSEEMQEGCYVSVVGELGDVATLQRFSGAWWYPGNVARSPHFLAHPLQKRNSLFAFLLVSLRCERKCGRGGGFLSNEPMITGLIAHRGGFWEGHVKDSGSRTR